MFKLTRELRGNIGQALLVVLLLPLLCLGLGAITNAANTELMVVELLGKIDFFEAAMNAVSAFMQLHVSALVGNPDLYLTHIASVFEALDTSVFQLLNVTLCVALCKLLWDILKATGFVRGTYILATVVGVVLGYFVVAAYNIPLMASIFLLLLYVVVDIIWGQAPGFQIHALFLAYIRSCLEFGFEMLASLWLSGFVAVLLIIWQGNISNIGMIIFLIAVFLIPWMLLVYMKDYIFPD